MIYNDQNHQCWHEADRAHHDMKVNDYLAQGWSLIALSIAGPPTAPVYAAAVAKPGVASGTKAFSFLSFDQFQQVFEEMAKLHMGCYLIAATGPVSGAIYAAAFRPMAEVPLTRHRLDRATFDALNLQAQQSNQILLTADSFGAPDAPSFCAVWGPNPSRVAWNAATVDIGAAELQQRFEASASERARPGGLAVTPSGRHIEMFVDSRIGDWASRTGMTASQYQQNYDALAKQALFPVAISADGPARRYAAIWARTDEVKPRKWTPTGPGPALPDVDQAMKVFVQSHNLRGAALAVCRGTRLVYTRGYTWAEDDHPIILPTTRFRLASVSKTFCAVAIWRLIQQNRLSLDTKLGDVLTLRRPDGSPPASNGFGDIRSVQIQHLLESRSGIVQNYDLTVAAAGASPSIGLPCTMERFVQYLASLELTGMPGDTDNSVYGNIDYLLLGQVLAAKTGKSWFGAIKELVLDPLQLNDTAPARTRADQQPAGETPYHSTVFQRREPGKDQHFWDLDPIALDRSRVSPGEPEQPQQYGGTDYEIASTMGGLASSAVDVARLYAMFSCRSKNPVLSTESIFRMEFLAAMASAIQRTPEGERSHGYHGFDGVSFPDIANHVAAIGKGGWLPAMGSVATGWTGPKNYTYTILLNGNQYNLNPVDWLQNGAVAGGGVGPATWSRGDVDWGATDLFVSAYHLPALIAEEPPAAAGPALAVPATVDPADLQRVLAHRSRLSPQGLQQLVQRSMIGRGRR